MNVKRKTVRFQDNLSDLSVYEAITNYKKYGYRSESHMVIEAVRRLLSFRYLPFRLPLLQKRMHLLRKPPLMQLLISLIVSNL